MGYITVIEVSSYVECHNNAVNNPNKSKRSKDRIIKRNKKRISGLVDELHWKSINYLTKNYKTILIGDISSRGVIRKSGGLSKINKRVANALKLYKFKTRLEGKCKLLGINYKLVDEHYTSKTCCRCGNIKGDLGCNKVYNCKRCSLCIDRDVNGAINIAFNSIAKK